MGPPRGTRGKITLRLACLLYAVPCYPVDLVGQAQGQTLLPGCMIQPPISLLGFVQGFVQGFMHGTLEILASEVNFHLKIACTSPPPTYLGALDLNSLDLI